MAKKCISCNSVVFKGVEFKCPSCQKEVLARCNSCRATNKEYSCPNCGFTGP